MSFGKDFAQTLPRRSMETAIISVAMRSSNIYF